MMVFVLSEKSIEKIQVALKASSEVHTDDP